MTDEQALQAPRRFAQARELYELALDFFPFRKGVQQQAVIAVDGQHHLAVAVAREGVAVAHRDGEAAFAVQR